MTTTSLTRRNPSLLQRVRDRFRRDYDQSKPTSPQALSLTLALRRQWADHVIWTREYVVAAITDAPDAGAVAGRLLKNQEDLGNAVAPFYGEAAGKKLTELLKEHIMIAVDLVGAAKSGDQAKLSLATRRGTATRQTSLPSSPVRTRTGRKKTSLTFLGNT